MKALSLHQPWASLCVPLAFSEEAVKTIETRKKSTKYRGRLLIHAALRRPPSMWLPPFPHGREGRDEPRFLVIDTITDPAYQGPQPCNPRTGKQRHIPNAAKTPTLFLPRSGPHGRPHTPGAPATEQGTAVYLPLGAIVGSVELVDVVPTDAIEWGRGSPQPGWARVRDVAWVNEIERPYGDFAPGRYAYLLADAKRTDERCPACWGDGESPGASTDEERLLTGACFTCDGKGSCDPIPAKGRQGLWEWTP